MYTYLEVCILSQLSNGPHKWRLTSADFLFADHLLLCTSVWVSKILLAVNFVSHISPSHSPPCAWRQTMRLEAGRLLGKQGTPLLPLGRGQPGGSGRQRGVSLKAGHTHPFHSPFIFILRRKPLHYELETASHLICWLPHHQEKEEIGFQIESKRYLSPWSSNEGKNVMKSWHQVQKF